MNPASTSHSKNFYNFNTSAYSTDSMRVYNKSPSNVHYPQNRHQPSIYSTMNNIQNLQSLKNQISQLQSVLTSQHRKSSFTKSKVDTSATQISNEKSFYTMIKEQLKQVNNLPNGVENNNNKKRDADSFQKLEQERVTFTPQGSALKNTSILKEQINNTMDKKKSEKQQALKSLLYTGTEREEKRSNAKIEESLRMDLQDRLSKLEQNKQERIVKLTQEFKNQKRYVEEEYQKQIQNELQEFENKLRKTLSSKNRDKKYNRNKKESILRNSKCNNDTPSLNSSDQSFQESYNLIHNHRKHEKSEKAQLVSSFKKDTSINKEKKQKVRFESDQAVRFKTENENSQFL